MIGLRSPIFRAAVRFTFFITNVFAFYLLLRGHNEPGGGFIAGLASAVSLILLSLALGVEEIHRLIRVDPARVGMVGLLTAMVSGMLPMAVGEPFLKQYNWHWDNVPWVGELHLGLPLLFDIGVYVVVVGVCCKIIFVLAKSTQGLGAMVAEEERRYSSRVETPIEMPAGSGKEGVDGD